MKKIFHNKPCIGDEESAAVQGVLQSSWIIAGEEVKKFENNFKRFIGKRYAIAVNSGTSALHLGLLSLHVQKGDEIIAPTYTSADVLNAIYYTGAKPVLVDNKKNACTMDTKEVGKKITQKTKAIIAVHTFGFPADMGMLETYGVPVIEDCAQAVGTVVNGKKVGARGVLSIFSFFATKLLTTGQGGMIVTGNREKFEFLRDLINYNGRDTYKVRYNYPLTDIAAAVGNVQLKKFRQFAVLRQKIANVYQEILERKNITHFPTRSDGGVIPFRFLFHCADQKKVIALFKNNGIEVKQPVAHFELLHRLLKMNAANFPHAESFTKHFLSLPMYPCLKEDEVKRIAYVLATYL